MSRKIIFLAVMLFAIILGFIVSEQTIEQNSKAIVIKGLLPKAVELKSFTLIDKNNQPVTAEQLKGKWSIVSIGYTNCPDICPATLQKYQQIREMLVNSESNFIKDTQFVFVSVDPKRDSIEHLKKYVEYFNPEFIGLTGDNKQLTLFSESIYAFFVIPDTSKENYAVGHSAALHILNDKGQLQALISAPYTADEVVENYTNIRMHLKPNREIK